MITLKELGDFIVLVGPCVALNLALLAVIVYLHQQNVKRFTYVVKILDEHVANTTRTEE